MNLILFGAPGAGKGTQSALLIERKKMYQISTGDLFRAAISNKTSLGVEAKAFMDKGELVPDRIVIGMVEELFKKGVKNFILDGFPRTAAQAEALEDLLKRSDLRLDRAIFLDVPYSALMSRLTGRRVCEKCGSVYHVESRPTKAEGVCDNCGGQVIQRNDDRAEVIETRLKAYESSTAPLREYYRKLNKYVELDGNRETELVYNDIVKFLN